MLNKRKCFILLGLFYVFIIPIESELAFGKILDTSLDFGYTSGSILVYKTNYINPFFPDLMNSDSEDWYLVKILEVKQINENKINFSVEYYQNTVDMFAGHPEEDYYTNESKWAYKFNQTYTIDKSLSNFILQIQDFLHVFYPIDIYLEDFVIEDFLNISLNSSSITHNLGTLEKYFILYLNDGNLSIGQSDEFFNYLSYLNGIYFINSSGFESIFDIEPSDFKFTRNIESSFHGTLFSELSFDFNLDEKLGTKFRGNVIFNISMEITLNEYHAIEYIKYYTITDFKHDSDYASGFQRTGTGFERILVYQEIKTLEPPTIPSFPLITLGLIIIASTGFNFKKLRRKREIV